MTKDVTITELSAPKAADTAQSCLFDHFCELMTRLFLAFEEEEWSQDAGWDIAFGQTASDADAAWRLVAIQAETVTALQPLSANDLLLHRIAGLVRHAVTATNVHALEVIRTRVTHCIAHAPMQLARAVHDLAEEALASIDQMIEHACACDGDALTARALPLAA